MSLSSTRVVCIDIRTIIYVFIILAALRVFSVEGQLQVDGFPDTSIKGAIITAECTNPTVTTLIWYRNGVLFEDRQTFSGTAVRNVMSFTVQPEDEGIEYTCTDVNNSKSVTRILTMVSETPSNPVIQDNVPSDLSENVEYTWICQTFGGYPEPTLAWNLDGASVAHTSISSVKVGRTFNVTITLAFTPTSVDDKKVLTCEMFHSYTFTGKRTDAVSMSVLYAPNSPRIEDFPTLAPTSGETVTASCNARGGNPSPSMAWYKNGTLYNTGVQTATEMDGNVPIITSKISFTVEPSDRGIKFDCTVWNTQGSQSTTKFIIDVNIKPDNPVIAEPSVIYADKEAEWTCTVDEVYPLPSMQFTLNGVVLENVTPNITLTEYGYKVVEILKYTPSSGDDKKTLFCVVGHVQTLKTETLKASTTLTVHSKPSVSLTPPDVVMKIGTNITLTCVVTSTLKAEVTWYKRTGSADTTITATMDGFELNQNKLTIKSLAISDEGFYFCRAKSDAGESDASPSVTVLAYTVPENTVISPPSLLVNESGTIEATCSTTVNPPDSVTFLWTFNGATKVSNSVLKLDNVKRSMAGIYTCTASNIVGSDQKDFSVNVQYKPESVVSKREYSALPGSKVKLICESDANPPASSYQWTIGGSNIGSNGNGNSYDAEVNDGTTIYICYASNSVGTSTAISFTVVGIQSGQSKESTPPDDSLSNMEIAAIALTVVVVVLCVAVVAYCCFLKDDKKKTKVRPRPKNIEEEYDKEYVIEVGRKPHYLYPWSSRNLPLSTPAHKDSASDHLTSQKEDISPTANKLHHKLPLRHGQLPPLPEVRLSEGDPKNKKRQKRKHKTTKQKKKFWKREAAEGEESPRQIIEKYDEEETSDVQKPLENNEPIHTLPDGTMIQINTGHDAQFDIKEL